MRVCADGPYVAYVSDSDLREYSTAIDSDSLMDSNLTPELKKHRSRSKQAAHAHFAAGFEVAKDGSVTLDVYEVEVLAEIAGFDVDVVRGHRYCRALWEK